MTDNNVSDSTPSGTIGNSDFIFNTSMPGVSSESLTGSIDLDTVELSGNIGSGSNDELSGNLSSDNAELSGNMGGTQSSLSGDISPIIPQGTLTITRNGTYDVTNYETVIIDV